MSGSLRARRPRSHARRATMLLVVVVAILCGAAPAFASWLTAGTGQNTARAADLATPAAPTVTANGTASSAKVSWQAVSLTSGQAATSYVVKRTDASGTQQVCAVSAPTLSCTDPTAVVNYASYTVSAKYANWTSPQSVATLYDISAPSTSLSTGTAANTAGWWATSPVAVTLTATDTGSGVRSITYQVGSASAVTVNAATTTFNVSTQGSTVITYKATDNAGNVESQKTNTIKLDTVAPAAPTGLAITPDNGASSTDGITDANNPTVTGNAEAGSTVEIRIDGTLRWTVTAAANGTFTSPAGPAGYGPGTELTEGSHTLSVRAIDAAGNVGSSTTSTIRVDRTNPTATLTGYCNQNDFCGTASDGTGSGIWRVTYEIRRKGSTPPQDACWNGTAFSTTACGFDKLFASGTTSWSGPIPSITASGTYVLTVRAEDLAGHNSPDITYTVTM
jgi:hypothetical protein